ncbi:MAG: hypothetical protein HY897_14610 [Deltaproteobacteria bacterium]|nr:hypothetical protein [Deltaproteobacteria bacterium]
MRNMQILTVLAAALLWTAEVVRADIPRVIEHQGFLTDKSGVPVTKAVVMGVGIYKGLEGEDLVWEEDLGSVEVKDGFYSVEIGRKAGLDQTFSGNSELYLEVRIDGEKLLPRQKIGAVPYSYVSLDAVGDIHPGSVSVGGNVVIDGNGKWVGDTGNFAGVKSVTAASPLTGGTITDTGTIGIAKAGDSSDGFLSKEDYTTFLSKQNRVSGTCNDGFCVFAVHEDGSVTCMPCGGAGAGTVTEVRTGLGLTGGPISASGEVALDKGYLDSVYINEGQADGVTSAMIVDGTVALADIGPNSCAANQVIKRDDVNSAWICAADADSNTTYGVEVGSGLALNGTNFTLLKTCAAGDVLKWDGAVWTCAGDSDTNSGGTVTSVATGVGLTGGPITMTGTISLETSYFDGSAHDARFVNTDGDTMTGALSLPADGLVADAANSQLVLSGGNVGIGTPTPLTKLEVAGNIAASAPVSDNHVATKAWTLSQIGASTTKTPKMQTFTANGTWVRPAGVDMLWVTLCGGGGGGGAGQTGGSGGGGGGGAQCMVRFPVSVGTDVPVVVGTGGAGGSSNDGSAGGNSSFATVAAYGGGGGKEGSNGGAGGTGGGGIPGSSSATPSDGSGDALGSTGGGGGSGLDTAKSRGGNSGGAYGGGAISGTTSGGGGGGSSLGKGGGSNSSSDGGAGSGFGAGGGGASESTFNDGGNGSPGVVIVEWVE